MGVKKALDSFPDISFIENMTIDGMQEEMLDDFAVRYQEITGEGIQLGKADPLRMLLYAACLQLYQGFQYIDSAAKQSFLKYSYGDMLENLGALKGIHRLQGAYARTRLRFELSASRPSVTVIPKGTRVTAGDNLYFSTVEALEIPAGILAGEVNAECREIGIAGNGYKPGKLRILVDPVAYVDDVVNISISQGGADIESDEILAERIYLAPSSYSTAGPNDAYVYWVKTFDVGIKDVIVTSPSPGDVDIRFIMSDDTLPSGAMVEELRKYLENSEIRPLTDHVIVAAPEVESYEIDFTYYINASERNKAPMIQESITKAVNEYIAWQKSHIGRDINPDQLRKLIITAGAKRADIRKPEYQVIDRCSIGVLDAEASIVYGGVEDD